MVSENGTGRGGVDQIMQVYQNGELKVDGIVTIRQLKHFYMKEQLNEHMYFSLDGDITGEDAEEYGKRKLLGQEIRIYHYPDGEETPLGSGIITGAEIEVRGDTYRIAIEGASASWNMTVLKKKRSFQNQDRTYRDLMKKIEGNDSEILYRCEKEELLNGPIIQYQETDWELLLRLAGQQQTVLVPDVLSGKTRVFFGLPVGTVHQLSGSSDVKLSFKNIREGKRELSCRTGQSIHMRLGDTAMLNNRKWWVVEKQAVYRNGLMEEEYTLGRIQDRAPAFTYNQDLRGAAVRGKVLKRRDEYLKLWLDMDGEQGEKDAFWFPYLPETGNLMYAMPEEGADAVLYFPDGKEKNGIVIHSLSGDGHEEDKRNHNIKEMKTPSGKGIRIWPGLIEVFGGEKRKTNTMYIGEETGVQLSSKKTVCISADEGIHIRSGQSCQVTAGNYISVSQGGKKNRFELSGNQIVFHAEKYYTGSREHKSKKTGSENRHKSDTQVFNVLYGPFTGMIAQGDCGAINDKILGGIPALGSVKGDIQMKNQMGLRIRRES